MGLLPDSQLISQHGSKPVGIVATDDIEGLGLAGITVGCLTAPEATLVASANHLLTNRALRQCRYQITGAHIVGMTEKFR